MGHAHFDDAAPARRRPSAGNSNTYILCAGFCRRCCFLARRDRPFACQVWHPSVLDLHLPFLERVPAAAASTIAAKRSSNNSDVRRQVVTHGAENGWQQLVEPRVVGGGASVAEAVRVTVGGLAAVAGNADYAVEVQRESQAAFEHRRQQDDGQHVRRFVNHIYKRGLAPSDLYGEPKCAASRGRWPSAPGYWFHDTGGGGRRGAQLFATAEAQRLIHEHQHPVDCAGKKFLVHSAHKAGIGSQVHMFGAALATAMSLGRIYVPVFNKVMSLAPLLALLRIIARIACSSVAHCVQHTRSAVWTEDRKYCKAGSTIDRCFLEAWTSCSVADTGYITNRNATYEVRLVASGFTHGCVVCQRDPNHMMQCCADVGAGARRLQRSAPKGPARCQDAVPEGQGNASSSTLQ